MDKPESVFAPPPGAGEYLCAIVASHKGDPEQTWAIVGYDGEWHVSDGVIVTHWMELPDLPHAVIEL